MAGWPFLCLQGTHYLRQGKKDDEEEETEGKKRRPAQGPMIF
jgi:hypothetical protein